MRPSVRSLRTALVAVLGAIALQTVALPAMAGDDDADEKKKALSIARAKFQQGLESEQVSDWVGALKLFREVAQTKMTPQVRFHVAVCEENLGHLINAMGGYQLALEEAKDPNAVPDTFRTQDVADKFRSEVEASITDLQQRVPKLTIVRGEGAEAATIELDDQQLGASAIGVEVQQDPGPHRVVAHLSGYTDFAQTFTLAEKQAKSVTVSLVKNLEADTSGSSGGGGGPMRDTGPEKPSRVVPYVIGGAGVVSLATSGVFFLLRARNLSDLADECPTGNCNIGHTAVQIAALQSKYDTTKTYGLFGWITAGVGVAAVGTAVAMIVLEPKPKKSTEQNTGSRGVRFGMLPSAPGADLAGASLFAQF